MIDETSSVIMGVTAIQRLREEVFQLRAERDAAIKRAEAAEAERDDAIIDLSLANAQRGILAAENMAVWAKSDALRTDAARLDWLADTAAIEAFGIDDVDAVAGCVGMSIFEHASIVADERGNDDDLMVGDQREGFRRMIDAARKADVTATDVLFPGAA